MITGAVIGLAVFGKARVQNMPILVPLVPAKNSVTAVDVIIPQSESSIKNDLVERPMFWKERRPYVPPVTVEKKKVVVEEEPGPDPFENITLMGIYSGGVMLKVNGTIQRVRVGETIEELDWSLDEIGSYNQVLFVLGDKSKILALEHAEVKAPKRTRKIPNKNAKKEAKKEEMEKEPVEKKSRKELGKELK